MTSARSRRLDATLPVASYRFLVLELNFKKEGDIPGLLRYKLESMLPRGLTGLRWFHRRIGKTRRFLITLVKEPLPPSFAQDRTRLPFALTIQEKTTRAILWKAASDSFFARYDGGCLLSVEPRSQSNNRAEQFNASEIETRDALENGPVMHKKPGSADRVWILCAVFFAMGIIAQISVSAAGELAVRQSRLAVLEEELAILSRSVSINGQPLAESAGLQSKADTIYSSMSSRWKPGYYLSTWNLKERRLRIEGWGPNALSLLASLRVDPELAGLELTSRKESGGYELFAFEGVLVDD